MGAVAAVAAVGAVGAAADEAASRDDAPASSAQRAAATRARFGAVVDVDVDDAAPLAACAASATTTSVASFDLRRDDDADRAVGVSVADAAAPAAARGCLLLAGGVAGVGSGVSPAAPNVGGRSSSGCVMSVSGVSQLSSASGC